MLWAFLLTNHLRLPRPGTVTVPKSPTFATSKRAEQAGQADTVPYRSMAQKVAAYQSDTPKRFHKPSKNDNCPILPESSDASTLTVPTAPMFATDARVRSTDAKSHAEIEEEMVSQVALRASLRPL